MKTISIQIPDCDFTQELDIVNGLTAIAQNISAENIKTLGDKSKKKGVNDKIKQFKHFI